MAVKGRVGVRSLVRRAKVSPHQVLLPSPRPSPAGGRGRRVAGLVLLVVLAVVLSLRFAPIARVEAWLNYRLTGYVPPPLVVGQHGRLFLGNHAGSPPGSLISDVCGTTVGPAGIERATNDIRPILRAGQASGLPFRFLIIPTAPRLDPQDLPPGTPCRDPAADRLVAALHDPAVIYPLAFMQALNQKFDVLPRHHFHWAGEGPLRVAEYVAGSMGLSQQLTLKLRPDNRSSDLNGFYPGVGLHDRIGNPNLRGSGVAQCDARCKPPPPGGVVTFTHPGPGRLLVLADSFGDELAGNFSEFAGQVWLVRMNLAMLAPPAPLAASLHAFHPTGLIVAYHDAGALALDPASQGSLAAVATLLTDAHLSAEGNPP